MPFTEARVTIHRKSSSIVMTGDVEISPAVVTYKGLTITTTVPEIPPSAENPKIIEKDFIPVDPQHKGGAKLTDLVDALNQLRVPAPDRITIVEQLYKTGKLHATVIVED
jgi:flagellar P-ring protein precursor FlgI